ncbi:hypothetical protein [Paeniglutamicibacter sp.]|uniref:hypothetical protein n=1 Tax=Paeniglutamicibacter sp. TaxID=1934391 RepID=UPI0039897DA2
MKKIALWALPIAATLAVAGCSGASAPDEATQPSPTMAVDASSSSSAPPTDPGSTGPSAPSASGSVEAASQEENATSDKQLTANDLFAVAEAVESRSGTGGTRILKDADLRASFQTVEEIVAGMKVSPAECGSFAMAGMSETLERVNMAIVVLPAESNDLTTSVTMASYDTADVLDQLQAQAKENTGDCSKFTLTMQGLEVSAVVKKVKASTTAKTTTATVTDVEVMGQSVTTLTVAGYDGRSNVTVSISQPKDVDTAVKKAEKYIDLALKQMADN